MVWHLTFYELHEIVLFYCLDGPTSALVVITCIEHITVNTAKNPSVASDATELRQRVTRASCMKITALGVVPKKAWQAAM